MLPTFPSLVAYRRRANQRLLRALVEQKAPMLRGISRRTVHEGSTSSILREDGSTSTTEIHQHSATQEIKRGSIEEFISTGVIKHLSEIADQFAKSMSESMIQTLSKSANEVGNVVDGQGQPLTAELLLQAFETITLDFNDDGTWNAPTIVVSPQQYERLMSMHTPEEIEVFNKKLAEIVERKRSEYRSREAGRVLAG